MVCAYAITTSTTAGSSTVAVITNGRELAYCLLLCVAQKPDPGPGSGPGPPHFAPQPRWMRGKCFAMLMLLVDFSFGFQSRR